MKKIIYLCLFLLFSNHVFSQQGWGMLRGEASVFHMVRGIMKQPHHNNTPALKDGMTWSVNGKLYLYGNTRYTPGGIYIYPSLDMWSFDTLTKNWTWLSGHNHSNAILLPNYGTKGNAAASVTPGYNQEAVTWVLNGKLYMYGGKNNDTSLGAKAALWMYDPTTNYWTWLDGGDSYYDDVRSIIYDKGINRGIQIYFKDEHAKGNPDFPFVSIQRINDRSTVTNGRLKKMIRFLKNVKSDSDQDIDLSSFDINAICYDIDENVYRNSDYTQLVAVLYSQLYKICNDTTHADKITSVDDREYIFRGKPTKLNNLRKILAEVTAVYLDIQKTPLYA